MDNKTVDEQTVKPTTKKLNSNPTTMGRILNRWKEHSNHKNPIAFEAFYSKQS